MSNSIAKKTINGVKWTTISTITNSVMQIGYSSIMAHLLSPKAFGLVALANIILRFGGYLSSMGLGSSIVQKKELSKEEIRAAFTSSLILGGFTTVLLWLLAPYSVLIFDEPLLPEVLRVMVLNFLLINITSTSVSLLRRNIRFKALAVVEIVSYVVGYIGVGVTMAYLGYGVWSLIYASVIQSLVFAIMSYFLERHSVLLLFSWKYYRDIFSYGSRISLISFTEFISGELDTMVIGKLFGSKLLGYYNRGFMLINLPIYFMTTSFGKVLFPTFSKLQGEIDKLKKIYLSSIAIVVSIAVPVGAGIAVGAHEIIYTMLGNQWEPSIPVLQILAVGISIGFASMFAGIICDATANLSKKIKLTISFIFIQMLLFYLLHSMGIVGIALAVALGNIIRTGLYIFLMNQILHLKVKEILYAYLPGIFNGIIVGIVLFFFKQILLIFNLPEIITLISLIIVGAVLLFSLIVVMPFKALKDQILYFLQKLDFTSQKDGRYNRMMLSYMNYLNRR